MSLVQTSSALSTYGLRLPPRRLIGRGHELRVARARLLREDVRLLTLVGPPGVGKTRLATELAASLRAKFVDRVFLVDLVPLAESALVPAAVAHAVGMPAGAGPADVAVLAEYLAERCALLVLDNFEHLAEAAPLVSELLATCRSLKVVATSREPLRLLWEHVLPVRPLAVPASGAALPLDALLRVPSVALFVERVCAEHPEFAVAPETAAEVAEICVRLDGLPLAIELAAAHDDAHRPLTLLEGLTRYGITWFAAPYKDLSPRHRTLARAIEWSYSLLPPDQQRVFRSLSLFPAGCTAHDAWHVCAAPGDDEAGTAAHLSELVRKHLAQVHALPGGGKRYTQLQTLRDVARQKLDSAGEADALERRRAAYILARAEGLVDTLASPQRAIVMQALWTDLDNLRAVLDWTLAAQEAEVGLRLILALEEFWNACGLWSEILSRLMALQQVPGETPAVYNGRALRLAGTLNILLGDYAEAAHSLERARVVAAEVADEQCQVGCALGLATIAYHQGDFERASVRWRHQLQVYESQREPHGVGWMLHNLGLVAREQGSLSEAATLFRQSIEHFTTAGAPGRVATALEALGEMALVRSDMREARDLFEASAALRRAVGAELGVIESLAGLAHLALAEGNAAEAAALAEDALARCSAVGGRRSAVRCLSVASGALSALGGHAAAARALGVAEAQRAAMKVTPPPAHRQLMEEIRGRLCAALGEPQLHQLTAAGAQLTPSRAIAQARDALAQRGIAPTEAHQSAPPASLHAFDAASSNAKAPWPAAVPPAAAAAPVAIVEQPTPREREVATLVARGLTNQQIAETLVISKRTAANHVQHLLSKLALSSRVQLAAWSLQQESARPLA